MTKYLTYKWYNTKICLMLERIYKSIPKTCIYTLIGNLSNQTFTAIFFRNCINISLLCTKCKLYLYTFYRMPCIVINLLTFISHAVHLVTLLQGTIDYTTRYITLLLVIVCCMSWLQTITQYLFRSFLKLTGSRTLNGFRFSICIVYIHSAASAFIRCVVNV